MTFKRRNGGRNKHGRGHVDPIRCSNCGKCCPKDKAIKRLSKQRSGTFKKPVSMIMMYCVSCAIHSHVVRVRSHTDRKYWDPPKRFFARKENFPKPSQPGVAQLAGPGNVART